MTYPIIPGNATEKIEISTYRIRTAVESHPNHRARPPQTPAIIRSFLLRVNSPDGINIPPPATMSNPSVTVVRPLFAIHGPLLPLSVRFPNRYESRGRRWALPLWRAGS